MATARAKILNFCYFIYHVEICEYVEALVAVNIQTNFGSFPIEMHWYGGPALLAIYLSYGTVKKSAIFLIYF